MLPVRFWSTHICAAENGNGDTVIASGPVDVPNDYFGICVEDTQWPSVGEVNHGLARSWTYRGRPYVSLETTPRFAMNQINPSSGVYRWGVVDEFLAVNSDKNLIIVLGSPPDYLVSREAIGGVNPVFVTAKANMCPDDLDGWFVAVTALANRIKSSGRTGLYWELWNEFDLDGHYADPISMLGPYTRVTVSAIKTVDPTAKIVSPSIVAFKQDNSFYKITDYYSASDGAGGVAGDHIDCGTAFHYYGDDKVSEYVAYIEGLTSAAAAAGINLPLYCTESGINTDSWSAGRRLLWRMTVFASLGVKQFVAFSWKDAYGLDISQLNNVGDLSVLSGKSLSNCFVDRFNRLWVEINAVSVLIG